MQHLFGHLFYHLLKWQKKNIKLFGFRQQSGLILGVVFLLVVNKVAENIEERKDGKKLNMLIFSVTLHNIPEGMAVGVCFAGFLSGNSGIALIEAIVLALGIAIQNIPEGAIISMPLKMEGNSKGRAFLSGVLSGIVEPIAAGITILLINAVVPLLPYLLSFAAGAMIFVVVEELVPEMHSGNKSALGVIRCHNRICYNDGIRYSFRLEYNKKK